MNTPATVFRTVIVDEEKPARENIATRLCDDPEIRIVAQCRDGREAAEAVLAHRPDILFLEVKRPGPTGLEALAGIPDALRPRLVFVAADDDHALEAFAVQAVDYLLKPIDPVRLAQALARAKAAVRQDSLRTIARRLDEIVATLQVPRAQPPAAPAPKVREGNGRIFIRCDGAIHLVAPEDIQWLQSDGDYVRLHTTDKPRLVRMPLSKMMQKLDPQHFVRIHRSTAVNLRHMSRATPAPYGEYSVNLANGTKLKVSRTFVRSLKTHL